MLKKRVLVLCFTTLALSSFMPAETFITQANVDSLKQTWKVASGSTVVGVPLVIPAGSGQYSLSTETLFVGTQSGSVKALNANTGSTIWIYQTNGGITLAPVTTGGNGSPITVSVVSSDGCLTTLLASTGMLQSKVCYATASTNIIALSTNTEYVTLATNAGNTGTIRKINTNGVAFWSYTTSTPVVGLAQGGAYNYGVVALTQNALLELDSDGNLLGSVAVPATPSGSPIFATAGISRPEQDLCPAASDTTESYLFFTAGSSVYASALPYTSGPGTPTSVNLNSSIVGNPALFFEANNQTITHRDPGSGLLVSCETSYYSDDVFYPLANGAVSAVYLSDTGVLAANGSEAVSVSRQAPVFILDQSNISANTGVVFAASGNNLLAIETPSGSFQSIYAASGAILGMTSEGEVLTTTQRVYFADSAGYVYALSPNGQ